MTWSVRGLILIRLILIGYNTNRKTFSLYENSIETTRAFHERRRARAIIHNIFGIPPITRINKFHPLGKIVLPPTETGMKYCAARFHLIPGHRAHKKASLNHTLNFFSTPPWKAPVNSLHAKTTLSIDSNAVFRFPSQEPSTRRVCTAGPTTRRPRRAPPPTTTATWATRWRRATSPARGGRGAPSACPRAPTFLERCVPNPTPNEFYARRPTVFIFLSLSPPALGRMSYGR